MAFITQFKSALLCVYVCVRVRASSVWVVCVCVHRRVCVRASCVRACVVRASCVCVQVSVITCIHVCASMCVCMDDMHL